MYEEELKQLVNSAKNNQQEIVNQLSNSLDPDVAEQRIRAAAKLEAYTNVHNALYDDSQKLEKDGKKE